MQRNKVISIVVALVLCSCIYTIVRMAYDEITIFANSKWDYYKQLAIYEFKGATLFICSFILIPYLLIFRVKWKKDSKQMPLLKICTLNFSIIFVCFFLFAFFFATHNVLEILTNWGFISITIIAFIFPLVERLTENLLERSFVNRKESK